jgi:fructokinase
VALADDGAQLARRRVATPRHDYGATLDAMVGLVRDLEVETGARGSVGVGMPGALSPASGLVKNANSTWLIGQPLDRGAPEIQPDTQARGCSSFPEAGCKAAPP